MDLSYIEILLWGAVGLLMYLAYKSMVRPPNFPPGPLGTPILGSLTLLKKYPERDMLELAKKYGNLFSLKTATQNYIVVCGAELNKEVLNHKSIVDRPATYVFNIVKGNEPKGIVHSNYRDWLKANRALVHSILTNGNVVKHSIDEIVERETTNLMNEFENMFENSEPSYLGNIIMTSFVTTLVNMIFGSKDDRTKEEKDKINEVVRSVIVMREVFKDKLFLLPQLIPGLQNIWLPQAAKKFLSVSDTVFEYCADEVELHKKTLDPEKPRDLVDLYLNKMNDEKDSEHTVFTKDNFRTLLFDIFVAGTENSSRTMEFTALYLAAHQDVQDKLYDEIIEVLGQNGKVQYEDRLKMNYINATTSEIFRLSTLTPTGVPRKAKEDFRFNGYSIPKGTIFMTNLYSANIQDNKWKNPLEFDPENFLDEEGKFVRNSAFMPFGGGLRKCIGVPLIKTQLFVYLVKLVRKFRIKPETDDTKIDYEPLGGILHIPKPQKLRLELRENDQ